MRESLRRESSCALGSRRSWGGGKEEELEVKEVVEEEAGEAEEELESCSTASTPLSVDILKKGKNIIFSLTQTFTNCNKIMFFLEILQY